MLDRPEWYELLQAAIVLVIVSLAMLARRRATAREAGRLVCMVHLPRAGRWERILFPLFALLAGLDAGMMLGKDRLDGWQFAFWTVRYGLPLLLVLSMGDFWMYGSSHFELREQGLIGSGKILRRWDTALSWGWSPFDPGRLKIRFTNAILEVRVPEDQREAVETALEELLPGRRLEHQESPGRPESRVLR